MKWLIMILSADGQDLLFRAQVEDEKEIQALASEARHLDSRCKIWISPPIGPDYPWD